MAPRREERGASGPAVKWYSFDPIAPWYDRTRILEPRSADRALRFLARRFPPRLYPQALEIGIGTGRIAFPFSAHGYRVVGVDISAEMLRHLLARANASLSPRPRVVRGDARRLPLRSAAFDVVYWVHVLHLVPGWRRALREALRVARPGGVLLGMWTEGGRDIPALSRFYRRCAREMGWPAPRLGVRRSETAFAYLASQGCRVVRVPRRWRWSTEVPVEEALGYLDARVFSTVRYLPLSAHRRIMRRVHGWARATFGPATTRVRVTGGFTMLYARTPVKPRRRRPRPASRQH